MREGRVEVIRMRLDLEPTPLKSVQVPSPAGAQPEEARSEGTESGDPALLLLDVAELRPVTLIDDDDDMLALVSTSGRHLMMRLSVAKECCPFSSSQ